MMAAVPGLLAKIWIKDADEEVYGGIYLWRDRRAYEEFIAGDLWDRSRYVRKLGGLPR